MRISIIDIITAAIAVTTITTTKKETLSGSSNILPSSPLRHNDHDRRQRSIITKIRGHYSSTISSRTPSPYHRHHNKSSSGRHTGRRNNPRLPSRHYHDSTCDNGKRGHYMSSDDESNYDTNHPHQKHCRRLTSKIPSSSGGSANSNSNSDSDSSNTMNSNNSIHNRSSCHTTVVTTNKATLQ